MNTVAAIAKMAAAQVDVHHHVLRHAPKDGVFQALKSMCPHDHEIDIVGLDCFEDFLRRIP